MKPFGPELFVARRKVGISVGWVEPASIVLGFVPQPNLRKSSIYRELILMGETQQNRKIEKSN
jgi:hypothetical protein